MDGPGSGDTPVVAVSYSGGRVNVFRASIGGMTLPNQRSQVSCILPARHLAMLSTTRICSEKKGGGASMNEQPEHLPLLHQIVADGQIIYQGENWVQAFLNAGRNPAYGEIVHLTNGEPGAQMGPVLIPRWSERKTHC